MDAIYGGIEAGGTKFICAVGSSPSNIKAKIEFPTTTPAETLTQSVRFFAAHHRATPLAGIGIAAFGPIDVNPSSPTYGYITTTPKPGWANVDFAGAIKGALNLPVAFDTDVNGAALGEYRWGAAQGLQNFIYLTVGTGIGGGGMMNGKLMHGLMHPEMGHIRIPHATNADAFPGCCPFHGDCLEGMASGKAKERRWGKPPEALPGNHPGWELEAVYLSLGVANLICALSPERVIVGGGIMRQASLLPLVRNKVQFLLNGYLSVPAITGKIEEYIVAPGLGSQSGTLGAIALAQQLVRT